EDPRQAAATGMRMLGVFSFFNANLLPTREAYPTRAYQSLGALAPTPGAEAGSPGDPRGVPDGIAIGDPARIVKAIKRWESIGVTPINLSVNTVEPTRQADGLARLPLSATEVIPIFRTGRCRALRNRRRRGTGRERSRDGASRHRAARAARRVGAAGDL